MTAKLRIALVAAASRSESIRMARNGPAVIEMRERGYYEDLGRR